MRNDVRTRALAALARAWRYVHPAPDERVARERAATLRSRALASCWVALAIIPFTILIYDGAFFPSRLGQAALIAAGADALILLLLFGIRRRAFDRAPWLPFALLAAGICNVAEVANVLLTGGVVSDFLFPYYVIAFGIAILYPAPIAAVVATAALLPCGYLTVALATSAPLGGRYFVSNLMLLLDSSLIAAIGNLVVTNLFLREVRLRIDLEQANEGLRELGRIKSEFFANVSHELRTPLTLILAPAASLARGTAGRLEASQRYMVQTIQRNATRLLHLINDLLLLAKIEAGEPNVTRIPVDVAAAVRKVAEETEAYASSLNLRLQVEVAPGGPFVWNGDERHLERVVLNLLSNACKFSRAGGVVRAAVEGEGDAVVLSVSDQGIGIAPQDLEKIFERFVQVESSSTRRFEGTGIGLSIVKELVTLHGGTISVQSVPDQGSTFRVRLPLLKHAPAPAPPPQATAPRASSPSAPEMAPARLQPALAPPPLVATLASGPRVLVVEDNVDLLSYLTQELGRWYRIEPVSDSATGLGTALADPPDLIVSDIMMPGMDGIELARKLRADPRTAEVPVVLLSAREEVEAKLAGFDAGADDYVQKPFELPELQARIELHLRLRRQARELRDALSRLQRAESSLVQSEKMIALGRMVAGVAHEMNNPLHFLRGNLSLLRKRVPADESIAPFFADIEESLERMTSVTRQLLLFGRKHEGDGGGVVKLSEVVPLVVKMVAPQTPKGVRIVQEVDGERVRANPQDLFQILLNIVHNAVQAVDPDRGEVRIAAVRAGGSVELRVADNGSGIAKEDLPRIFDPFFTTKAPGAGTGLGLSIVQELVANQHGTVRVESEPGRGTTFAVALPEVSP